MGRFISALLRRENQIQARFVSEISVVIGNQKHQGLARYNES